MLPDWTAPYIGLPYRLGARGPDAYDCWGLVCHVLRDRFGAAVPDYTADAREPAEQARVIRDRASDWLCLGQRPSLRAPLPPMDLRPGDVVLMRRGLWPCHVGVIVAPGWMLHSLEAVGCAADRLDGPEAVKIVACYRYRGLA